MILAEMTWKEVEALSRDTIVVIPTGSIEQHGPFLPTATDTLIATAVTAVVEKQVSDQVMVTPTIWLGASGHHLPFAGTLSASVNGYMETLTSTIQSLAKHRFHRFLIINGHGGNNEPNGVTLRQIKEQNPNLTLGHRGYYQFAEQVIAETLEGSIKGIQHACEAEVSLMLHLHPEKVRKDLIRDDGLRPVTPVQSLVKGWDEISEEGSFGFATLGTAVKGKRIFDACVEGIMNEIEAIHAGVVYRGIF
jgi:creatinine amidohydrolase